MTKAKHIVAIFGGAVSGAEAANQLTQKGIRTVVFDQNILPYGKIEDGLPKWHEKLRDKEENKINEKLSHPLVSFVPKVKLGSDLRFEEVVKNWGFSAVLLATGAWRDRPLPIEGIDDYINKGLYYQNPFIYWFNHKHEPGFQGADYDVQDGAVIIGGGLASLDVAKVLMFETVQKALLEKGQQTNLFELDRSIAKVLESKGLTLADLGIKACTIYYRRRVKDMPLSPMPADTPEKLAKAQMVREKILGNFQRKFLFNVEACHIPIDKIVEGGRLAGLVFRQTKIEDGRVVQIPGTEKEVRAPLFISSIGSIPEVIDGIPMDGQVYRIQWEDCCRVEGFDHVFALGNAVTGRGNIKESFDHGKKVALSVAENYLSEGAVYEQGYRMAEEKVVEDIDNMTNRLDSLPAPSDEKFREIMDRVRQLQEKAGYGGDFHKWVQEHLPVRLEDMIKE